MLRAVIVSEHDDYGYSIYLPSSALLATQMFRQAIEQLWPGNFQLISLRIKSVTPSISERLTEMSSEKRASSLHDQLTRVVVLVGEVVITKVLKPLTCTCTIDNRKRILEPRTIQLTLEEKTHQFCFEPEISVGSIDYIIKPGDGNTGSQPAKT